MRQKTFYLIMVPVVLAMLGSANSALAGRKTGKLIHDAEYYAQLLVTDAGTMLTEAAILGTPGIHCSGFVAKRCLGNLIELEEKYQLTFNYSEPDQAIAKADGIARAVS